MTMIDCQVNNSDQRKEGKHISCTHCQETGDSQIYWGIQLDQDLLETLISIYPDWFSGYNLNLTNMTDNNNSLYQLSTPSPPKSEVDENSLQKSMDKNKESLKVKLMLRRPISQLIDQGIMPPLKTPPAFHEQRQKLERAKTGDILKGKIQRRPARQQLIQQHILEDTTADPSLQERQRLLKKARLQDDLNDRLSHRPGPLELIKGNILKTDESLAQAIKEGQLTFRNTSEGELRKHPGPLFFFEEDSGSDGAPSPHEPPNDAIGSTGSLINNNDCQRVQLPSPASLTTTASSVSDIRSPLSSLSSPGGSIGSPTSSFVVTSSSFNNVPTSSIFTTSPSSLTQVLPSSASCPIKQEPGGGKARKKSKSKSQPKARTIKFHEYKGPPNAQKNSTINNSGSNSNDSETTYDLLLQQQQLFLQWQLEWQHKYPQILLPASQKNCSPIDGNQTISLPTMSSVSKGTASNTSTASNSRQSSPPASNCLENGPGSPLVKAISKLEDLKVSDLKAELKKRNLPVSGPKPQLIERLKLFSDQHAQSNGIASGAATTPVNSSIDLSMSNSSPPSVPINTALQASAPNSICTDDTSTNSDSPSPSSPMESINLSPSVTPVDLENSSIGSTSMDTSENNCSKPSAMHEENLKQQHKRIQELQNELQRSQLKLQKHQNLFQHQHQTKQNPSPGSVGSNTTKMLQQHLQQKIHQQNLQRQKLLQQQELQQKQVIQQQIPSEELTKQLQPQTVQIPIVSKTPGNITLANPQISLSKTLTGQLLIGQNVLTTANIPFVTLTNNNQVNIVNSTELPIAKTVRANSLPNGIGYTRPETLVTFTQPTPPMQRTTTDPQFLVTRPPPAYDDVISQVNAAIMDDKNNVLDNKKSKNQAIEDVLEILIRNGELPASVVQEPSTPNQNKSSSEPPAFPSSPSTVDINSSVKSEPVDVLDACLNELLSPEPCNQSSTEPSNFELDLELELEELESMDLSNLPNEVKDNSPMASNSNMSFNHGSPIMTNSNIVSMSSMEFITPSSPDDPISMDVDMDWFDSIISSPSTPITNNTIATNPPTTVVQQQDNVNIYSNDNENNRDPMLSVTSAVHDPLDLFSLNDTDFKGPADLSNQLSWDRIDFAS